MSRAHLALNVSDLEASLTFSSALFGVESHRRGPRFVNDASDEAALKLGFKKPSFLFIIAGGISSKPGVGGNMTARN